MLTQHHNKFGIRLSRLFISFVIPITLLLNSDLVAQDIKLKGIAFKGNKKISDGLILSALETKVPPWYRKAWPFGKKYLYDDSIFLTDLLRIEKFYQQNGFLKARVVDFKEKFNKKRTKVSIVIQIDEGDLTRVSSHSIRFEPDTFAEIPERSIQKWLTVTNKKPYRELDIRADYDIIIRKFKERGYPYINAKLYPIFDRENATVALEWRLNPGEFCHFGEIKYSGNESVENKAIKRGLGFSPGDEFNQSKLIEAQSQIYRLELFQFVSLRTINLENRPTNIPIEVKVKESKLRTAKFGLGYGTEESIRGFVQWRHRNFLGGARILRFTAKHSRKLLPLDLALELSQPFFLSNRNDLILKPFFKWQDPPGYEVQSLGVELTLNRRITNKTNVFITTAVQKDTLKIKEGFLEESIPTDQDNSKSKLRLGITHNTTDMIFTPTKGFISSAYIEEAGRFIQTSSKYLKFYLQHRLYQKVGKKNVFAFKAAAGSMGAIRGGDLTPIEDRFFLGGSYSVRGWGLQDLGPIAVEDVAEGEVAERLNVGGNSVIEGSFEWRRQLIGDFGSALFLDFGNVWDEWDQHDITDLHYAIGAGLRYNTLIGPIRIDVGWKLNKQEFDKDRYVLHLSIGQAF